MVDHELLLAQVVHEQIADRMTGQVVPGDELFGAQLALRGEHTHRGRRLGREHLHRVEQLIEVHARAQAPAELPGQPGQLQAVAGSDVGDRASLARHDDRDAAQGDVASERTGLLRSTEPSQRVEPAVIAGPGDLGSQIAQAAGCQQPRCAGTDHVCADQQQQTAAQPGIGTPVPW